MGNPVSIKVRAYAPMPLLDRTKTTHCLAQGGYFYEITSVLLRHNTGTLLMPI